MNFQNFVTVVEKLITAGALVMGGFWTYFLYTSSDDGVPHADFEQSIRHWKTDTNTRHVFADLKIKNTGKRRFQIPCARVEIRQIYPAHKSATPQEETGAFAKRLASQELDSFVWQGYLLQGVTEEYSTWTIGPDETDRLLADFDISADVQIVQVFAKITDRATNPDCKGFPDGNVGWETTDEYDLTIGAIPETALIKALNPVPQIQVNRVSPGR